MYFSPEIKYIDESRKSEIQRFMDEWHNEHSFVIAYTSGSTGQPKEIQLAKKYMINSAIKTLKYFDLKHGDSIYLALSTDTIAGKMMLIRSIVGQLKLIVGPVSTDSLLKVHLPIDFTAIVPLQLERTLSESPEQIKKIEKILVGGAPINSELIDKIIAQDLTVYQSYGMTETMSHVAIRKINKNNNLIYNSLNNITFSINESNELIIHAPDLGLEALKTNDLIELHTPTSFTWLGRSDFIINSGGKKLNPETIENKLAPLIQIPYFIHGIFDKNLGNKAVLVLETNSDYAISKNTLELILEKYEMPKMVVCIEKFIRTISGKIERQSTYNCPHVSETLL
jgi:O-succinylbenzoic acid--CoA ligase